MNILWQQPDNTLAVTSIFDDTDPAEHAAELQERGNIPADWKMVATGIQQFPQDWPRQEDWRFVDGVVVVDMNCAKETTRQRLRTERAPLLAVLDVQFQRNMETGADNAAVIAEKNRLRNITAKVDDCTTLEQLKALQVTA